MPIASFMCGHSLLPMCINGTTTLVLCATPLLFLVLGCCSTLHHLIPLPINSIPFPPTESKKRGKWGTVEIQSRTILNGGYQTTQHNAPTAIKHGLSVHINHGLSVQCCSKSAHGGHSASGAAKCTLCTVFGECSHAPCFQATLGSSRALYRIPVGEACQPEPYLNIIF